MSGKPFYRSGGSNTKSCPVPENLGQYARVIHYIKISDILFVGCEYYEFFETKIGIVCPQNYANLFTIFQEP